MTAAEQKANIKNNPLTRTLNPSSFYPQNQEKEVQDFNIQ